MPDSVRVSSFYKFIIGIEKKINLSKLIIIMNKKGIPINRVYYPLNKNSNFSKKNLKKLNVSTLKNNNKFPITNNAYFKKLFQIDINSLVKKKHLDFFLNYFSKKIV